ncbi:hypothetical protein [Schleiferilactobacillus harbinensis]|uniref:hypothetical protein n=1 Tax=Schleiferilactobacillus harbinensis TaxID=304207 RepID=UPI001174E2F1|nr:hypothetical protein [Schleiferilactobacillus harbinensis]GEK06433.1 hypothetical protein LHA01_16720 [Schleiferilactobacillus harbinensis]
MSYQLPDSQKFKEWLDNLSPEKHERLGKILDRDLAVAKRFEENRRKRYAVPATDERNRQSPKNTP